MSEVLNMLVMNRKSNCWDNAVAEPFFKTFENKLIHDKNYKNQSEAKIIYSIYRNVL